MKVKMYMAFDSLDSITRLFAVRGNEMAAIDYTGEDNSWLSEEGFGNFNNWYSEPLNESRMINSILIWESEND